MLEWMHWTWPSALGFSLLFGSLAGLALLDKRVPSYPRKGFLPMETTRGDRVFVSVMLALLLVFASLRLFPERPLWGAAAAAAAAAATTLRWG